MTNLFLIILSFGAVFSSLLTISATNPVISVIFLISLFINAAGYLILLGVGFIGLAYILLYVGAITVLFLFVIMMINIKISDITEVGLQFTKSYPLAIIVSVLYMLELTNIIPFTLNDISIFPYLLYFIGKVSGLLLTSEFSSFVNVLNTFNPYTADTTITNFLHIQAIGHGLYTYGASLLILCSIILLLAMSTPIFISKRSKN